MDTNQGQLIQDLKKKKSEIIDKVTRSPILKIILLEEAISVSKQEM